VICLAGFDNLDTERGLGGHSPLRRGVPVSLSQSR